MLYKYRPLNRNTMSILLNSELYFSDPNTFNDPFDSEYSIDLPIDIAKNALEFANKLVLNKYEEQNPKEATATRIVLLDIIQNRDINYLKKYLIKILGNSLKLNKINIGICSLSKVYNNTLMWSHYAKNHSGICIGFDDSTPLFKDAKKIEYSNHYYLFNMRTFNKTKYILDPFLRKSWHWRYEKEYRIISRSGPGLQYFDPISIKRIYFGCRASDEDVELVKRIIAKHNHKILLYKLEKSISTYQLILNRI